MGAFVLDSANKIKGVALAVAIALHGVAGFGVANMQIKTLTPPKITPPLEVEFIKPEPKPEPEKIILNNLESPEPVKVEPKPAMESTQAVVPPKGDTQVSEVKDSPSSDDTPPATQDVATPPQTIETDPVHTTPITPSSESTPDVVPDTPTVEPVTPVVTTTITPVTSSDDHTVTPATNPVDAQDNNIAPVTTPTTVDNTPTSTPPASATPANVSPTNAVNNTTTNNQGGGKNPDAGAGENPDVGAGTEVGVPDGTATNTQPITNHNWGSLNNSSASWLKKPNLSNLQTSENNKAKTDLSLSVTFDEQGQVSAVNAKSGDSALDGKIEQAVKSLQSVSLAGQTIQLSTNLSFSDKGAVSYVGKFQTSDKAFNKQLASKIKTLKSNEFISNYIRYTAQLKVNAEGGIDSVKVITSTGDRKLDDELAKRIKKAKLHPHVVKGSAASGTATYSLTEKLSN